MERQKKNRISQERPTGNPTENLEGEDYPVEDRALKEAARFMGRELLPLLGVEGSVRRVGPTEAVFLEVKDFLADFNYEMTDGTWRHLEFESDSISVEDLRRFRACEAVLSYKYHVEVSTYVLCTSKVKVLKSSLEEEMNTYQVKILRMKDYDADKVIPKLEKKQRSGKRLKRKELLPVLLTSLMDGSMSQEARVRRSFEILQKEQGNVKKREMMPMQAVLYALAMKVLTEDEMKRIKEMMTMTLLGQMLMEDGMKKGMEQGIRKGMERGEFKNMQELIRDGILTVEAAAARKNLTVTEYQRKVRALKLD